MVAFLTFAASTPVTASVWTSTFAARARCFGSLRCLASLIVFATLVGAARAQSAYPMIMHVDPAAIQVGAETNCELTFQRELLGNFRLHLAAADQVIISGQGVTGRVIKPEARPDKPPKLEDETTKDTLKIAFKVDASATPGVRQVRFVTPRGASSIAEVVIVADPIQREQSPNETIATAQQIKLPTTICGSLDKAEDVDVYKFNVATGSGVTFHVQASRLQHRIHHTNLYPDPMITIRDAKGAVLASCDNYFAADPLLHHRFVEGGDYYLEIRDVRYGGHRDWFYSIEAHARPFAVASYPLRVIPGSSNKLELIGFNLPPKPTCEIMPPMTAPDRVLALAPKLAGSTINAIPLFSSNLPDVREAPAANDRVAAAQPIAVPAGVSGRLEQPGDVDQFAFTANAGDSFTFEAVARRVDSPIDTFLRVVDAKGQAQVENDDMKYGRFTRSDSRIATWTAPAAGSYAIEVRDLNLRGGADYVYYLKATRSGPRFNLETDSDRTMISPGASAAIFVRAFREGGFTGDVQLAVEGLPKGVTAACGRIASDGRDGCIVLTAAPDAQRCASHIKVTGRGTHTTADGKTVELVEESQTLAEIYMPGGGRGNLPVDNHIVVINDPADVQQVKVSPESIVLKPGGSQKIDITITRRPGFKDSVSLEVVYTHLEVVFANCLPKGVTVDTNAKQLYLSGDQCHGWLTLKADEDAKPIEDHQLAVLAHIPLTFVARYTLSSPAMKVSVRP